MNTFFIYKPGGKINLISLYRDITTNLIVNDPPTKIDDLVTVPYFKAEINNIFKHLFCNRIGHLNVQYRIHITRGKVKRLQQFPVLGMIT